LLGHAPDNYFLAESPGVAAEQTRAAAVQGAKLIVWPELGFGFDLQLEHTANLKALAAETDAYLLIGYGITEERKDRVGRP
jgi:apolipoprotein N-acyltransferase